MALYKLTELQYSKDREGPWGLYVFDANGFHRGAKWFDKDSKKDRFTAKEAWAETVTAIANGREVRITDTGDDLVFHSQNGKVVYGQEFWKELGFE